MELAELIANLGITATAELTDFNPYMTDAHPRMDHWRVTLRRKNPRRSLTVVFSMGEGHNGKPPQADDILDCLAADANDIDNARDFEDWASDYGYDTDSREAYRTFQAITKQRSQLARFMGDDYATLLYETERL